MKFKVSQITKILLVCFILSVTAFIPIKTNGQQKVWTLEECIQYALDNNINIQRQQLQTNLAQKNLKYSKLAVLPRVNAGMYHTLSIGRSLNIEDYSYVNTSNNAGGLNASASMNIFSGFQLFNTISQLKFNYLASIEDLEYQKNQTSLFIAGAYLNILLNQELLNVAKSQVEVTKQQLERTRIFYEEGQFAKSALLEIQAQLALEELGVTTANNQLRTAVLGLSQLLRLQSPENFSIAIPENLEINIIAGLSGVSDVYDYAVQNLPEIKGAEYRMKSSEKGLAVARSITFPSLSLSAGINSRYSELLLNSDPLIPGGDYPYIDQIKDNKFQAIQLNLNIPIFNQMQNRSRITNAKIMAIDSKLQLDQAKQTLYQEIQQSHSAALSAMDLYKSSETAVNSSAEAFDFTEKRYEVGIVPPLEYNISKNNLTSAESDLIRAKYGFIFRLKILEFYKGIQLSL